MYGRMIDSKLSATLGLKNDDIWGGRKKHCGHHLVAA